VLHEAIEKAEDAQFVWERGIYEKEIEREDDKKRKALYYHELGEIFERRLRKLGNAGKAYGQAVRLNPAFRANLAAVRRILFRREKWANVLKILDAELKLASSSTERADLLLEKAHLLERELEDPSGAQDCYRDAFEQNPKRLEALMALERLHSAQGDFESLVEICRRHAEAAQGTERKSAIYQVLARLMGKAGLGYEERKGVLREAEALVGGSENLFWDLERLAIAHEQFADLRDIVGRRADLLEAQQRHEEALAVRRQQARVALFCLGEPDDAWRILSAQREKTPTAPQLLVDLTFLGWRCGRWAELADLLAQRLEQPKTNSVADQRTLTLERSIALVRSGEAQQAVEVLQTVVDDSAEVAPDIRLFFERAAMTHGDSAALSDSLEKLRRSLEAHPPSSAARGKEAYLARFLTLQAQLLAARATCSESADGHDDAEDETQQGVQDHDLKASLLQRAGELCDRALALDPNLVAANGLREELWTRAGRLEELATWQRERLADADPDERVRLLESLVDLYRGRLGDFEKAIWALEQLAQNDPEDTLVLLRWAGALQEAGRWEAAAEVVEKLAAAAMDPQRQADLLLFAADLRWDKAEDADSALKLLKQAAAAAPDHPLATVMLEEVLRRAGRWEEMAAVLRDVVGRTLDPQQMETSMMKLAEVLELRLNRPDEAAAVYEELLEKFPESTSAPHALTRVWRKQGAKRALAGLLERQADEAVDADLKSALYEEAAGLYEQTADPQEGQSKAEELLQRTFELRPQDRNLAWGLTRMQIKRGDWAKTAETLETHLVALKEKAAITTEPEDEAGGQQDAYASTVPFSGVAEELAWVLEIASGDFGGAWEQWQPLRSQDYAEAHRAGWAEIRNAVRETDLDAQARIEAELAQAYSGNLKEAMQIRSALHAVVAGRPCAPVWKKMAQDGSDLSRLAASVLGDLDPEDGAELLAWRANLAEDTFEQAICLRAEALCLDRQGKVAEAAETISRVLTLQPEDYATVEYAAGLARRAGDDRALAGLLVKAGCLCSDDEEAATRLSEGAELLEAQKAHSEAAGAWRQVLVRRPGDEKAFQRLAELMETQQDWEGLVGLLSHRITVRADEAEEIALYLRRAEILEKKHSDCRMAAADLKRVLQLSPQEPRAALRLGRLYANDGDLETARKYLQTCLEAAEDTKLRRAASFLLAEVLERKEQSTEALALLEDAVEQDPEAEVEGLERLLVALVRRREWERAVATLDRIKEQAADERAKALIERRKARLYRELMVNEGMANACLETARTLDPVEMAPVEALVAHYKKIDDGAAVERVLESASATQRELLTANLRVEPLRNLARIAMLGTDNERRYWALACLSVLGALDATEKKWYREQREQSVTPAAQKLTEEVWRNQVVHPHFRVDGPWELWQRVAAAAYKIYEVDLSKHNIGRGERVSPKDAGGVFGEIVQWARAMGVSVADWCRWPGGGMHIRAAAQSGGIAMMVGERLAEREDPLSRDVLYLLGKVLGRCRTDTVPLLDCKPADVQLLMTAAAHEGGAAVEHSFSSEQVDGVARTIKKALSRKERKALGEGAMVFARAPFSAEQWLEGIRQTEIRCGLVLSGNLEAAISDVMDIASADWKALDSADRAEKLKKKPIAMDLITYAVSDALRGARQDLGLVLDAS
jgi:tetratricopeptide (TPR) repeat protein